MGEWVKPYQQPDPKEAKDFGVKYGYGKIMTKKPNRKTTWKQSCESSKKAPGEYTRREVQGNT